MELAIIQQEINKQLSNKEVLTGLLSTTFKGLSEQNMRQALAEGMYRGLTFQDFLEKNVYAIPYSGGYSLVTSIDYARKIAQKNKNYAGKSKPEYEFDAQGNILTCSVTINKKVDDYVGDFSSLVFFKEFNTGKNQWTKMPGIMIAKVAEMHALRMAFPEELSQMYTEEEMREPVKTVAVDLDKHRKALRACKTIEELKKVWTDVPGEAKKALEELKEEMKAIIGSEVTYHEIP